MLCWVQSGVRPWEKGSKGKWGWDIYNLQGSLVGEEYILFTMGGIRSIESNGIGIKGQIFRHRLDL